MKIKDIEKEIGTLSNTTKMPSYSWGIPTEYCKTGSKLALIPGTDRKSTRLNSSHGYISYAVFCLKKKKSTIKPDT
mgnify:CR=1 FL=1